ncbi:MAG: DUF547 domain-containing protein [Parvibaculum sp.]
MIIREILGHCLKHRLIQCRCLAAGLLMVGTLAMGSALAAKPAGAATMTEQQETEMPVDHQAWQRLLNAYLVEGEAGAPNLFNYAALSANEADRDALELYITGLEGTSVSKLSRNEQFAFWANLYNATTVRVILDHYPVRTIRDIGISPGLFSKGPWGAKLVTVEGKKLSLDDIEHVILRAGWQDPRVHYAVNCASIGCPDLPTKPFAGKTLEADLDAAARAYINAPRGVTAGKNGLTLSKIYDWYSEDFGGSSRDLLNHLSQYADEELGAALASSPRIRSYAYDWSLNEAPSKR